MNLYLTPAGAQEFRAHMDGHEVFVLQLDGPKRWEVYKPNYRLPLESRIADGELGKAVLSPELEPGDLLYIPRGFIHRAHTTDASSLHLTIGVQSWRWVDVLHRAVDALRRSRILRCGVRCRPPRQTRRWRVRSAASSDGWRKPPTSMPRPSRLTARKWPSNPCRFRAADSPPSTGWMRSTGTVVRHRPGIRCSLSRDGQTSVLQFGDRSLDLPTSLASTLEFVAGHRSFCADSLPGRLKRRRQAQAGETPAARWFSGGRRRQGSRRVLIFIPARLLRASPPRPSAPGAAAARTRPGLLHR